MGIIEELLGKMMFNKKKIEKLEGKVAFLEGLLLVNNYFKDCPCCGGQEKILRSEAVSFKKVESHWGCDYVAELFTDKESYRRHLPAIKEWEKEASQIKN